MCWDTKLILCDTLNLTKIALHCEIFRHIEWQSILATYILNVPLCRNAKLHVQFMKLYDLIPNHFPLLKTKWDRFDLCEELCKLNRAEMLKLNDKENNLCNKYILMWGI